MEPKTPNKSVLPLRPYVLISFWDMIQIHLKVISEAVYSLQEMKDALERPDDAEDEGDPEPNDLSCYREEFKELSESLETRFEKNQFKESIARCNTLVGALYPGHKTSKDLLLSHITELLWSLRVELLEVKCVYIPPKNAGLFEREDLFGIAVATMFPEAKLDIKAAGTCLAIDLNTAAIFHLMRAAEYGLRSLARDMQIPMTKSPIEFKTWGAVIDSMDEKMAAVKGPASPHKSEELEFYSSLIQDAKSLKNLWRDEVMHARNMEYTDLDALSAYGHVKRFMEVLAGPRPLPILIPPRLSP